MASGLNRAGAAVELHRALLNRDGEAFANALAFQIANYGVLLEEDALYLITEVARAVRTTSRRPSENE